ncbi:hypothetical protein [Streptomyces sp. C36]|uniref:hypothetical protein n=1 Tax=Streptomyces sp. C36 TaxID=3237122 RepID=UPI0034C6A5FE
MTRAPESASAAVYALLADGTTVCVRPVVPADRAAVFRLYERMSPENLRLRFFASGTLVAQRAADALCVDAGPGDRALVAETGARMARTPPGPLGVRPVGGVVRLR